MPVRYFVTDAPAPQVTVPELVTAVKRAFPTWQAVPTATVRAEFQGTTIVPPGLEDGRTTLGFLDRPELDRVLGATSFLLDATTGEIVEADVFFNTRFAWSTAPAAKRAHRSRIGRAARDRASARPRAFRARRDRDARARAGA